MTIEYLVSEFGPYAFLLFGLYLLMRAQAKAIEAKARETVAHAKEDEASADALTKLVTSQTVRFDDHIGWNRKIIERLLELQVTYGQSLSRLATLEAQTVILRADLEHQRHERQQLESEKDAKILELQALLDKTIKERDQARAEVADLVSKVAMLRAETDKVDKEDAATALSLDDALKESQKTGTI